jgi:hypothetical protein
LTHLVKEPAAGEARLKEGLKKAGKRLEKGWIKPFSSPYLAKLCERKEL